LCTNEFFQVLVSGLPDFSNFVDFWTIWDILTKKRDNRFLMLGTPMEETLPFCCCDGVDLWSILLWGVEEGVMTLIS
jgi:hypothetical protein